MSPRTSRVERATKETAIELSLDLDAHGTARIETGIGMLDHLIHTFAHHARFDVALTCRGDLRVDDHHTVEDCAIALGTALDRALEGRAHIARFGYAYAPLDEALARVVVDLATRPFATVALNLTRERLGELACENVSHFLRSFATSARITLHCDVIRGENDHHKAEATFKALALALRQACARTADETASTKGAI